MAQEIPQEESLRSMTPEPRRPFVLFGAIMGWFEDNTARHDQTRIQTSMTKEMCPLSSASPMNQETSMPQTKKNEPTTIRLFGATITASPQEPSSVSTPLVDGSTKKRRRTDEEDLEASYSPQAQNPRPTCGPRNDELKNEAIQVKKKRNYRPREILEKVEPTPPWTIAKALPPSDLGTNVRFTFETKHAQEHILPHLSQDVQNKIEDGTGVKVKVYDEDTETEHGLCLKRYIASSKDYVLNGGWDRDFVKRRRLKKGDVIGFFWNVVDSRLHFSVLTRAPADQNNPN